MILSFIIKPTHLCNFSCTYCYNEDERRKIMNEMTLKNAIINIFDYANNIDNVDRIEFIWHGGEPLMAGIKFFEKALYYQKKYNNGIKYMNSIQTNGYLLDDNWLKLILLNKFSLSVSLDGPEYINNKTRKCYSDKNFFSVIENNLLKAKQLGISVGLCAVISKQNISYIKDIFEYFEQLGINYNIIPINMCGSAKDNSTNLYITPEQYGNAWNEMFDLWLNNNSKLICSDFVFKVKSIIYGIPFDCIGSNNCSLHNFSLDEHGNVFPCATLSGDNSMMYGNINIDSLITIVKNTKSQNIIERKVNNDCLKCNWKKICNSGCFARAYKNGGCLDNSKDFYCLGLKIIYSHVYKKINELFMEESYEQKMC